MTKQEEIYVPMLNDFSAQFKDCWVSYLYGLFLPNNAPKYYESSPKFFYVGKETKNWEPNFREMLDLCSANNSIEYIKKQNNWIIQGKYFNEAKNPFWQTIIKLHIYLHTGEQVTNIKDLNENQKELLKTIGWGNINSIITKEGLDQYAKEGDDDYDWWGNEDITYNLYDKIKKASRIFDKLKFILDIYNPDIIFIFNENKKEEKDYKQFIGELKITGCQETFMYDDYLISYNIEGYNTKIIWTKHPRYMSNIEDIKKAYDILMQKGQTK
jgi:hypothetical protein